jgi:peptide/nickel transport system permease protein
MGAFLVHLLIETAKVAGISALFGVALMPHFKKCGLDTWKAFVPFYNILTWINLTKNSVALFLLIFWAFPLPLWWLIMFSFGSLMVLTLDTHGLYKDKYPGALLFTLLFALLGGFFNSFDALHQWAISQDDPNQSVVSLFASLKDIPQWIFNLVLLLVPAGLLMSWGSNSDLQFDKGAYHAEEFSFQKYAFKQFRKNRPAVISTYVLGLLVVVAVYAPYIANDQPLYAEIDGKKYFPAWSSVFETAKVDTITNERGNLERIQFDIAAWKQMKLQKVVWAPVAFDPNKSDRYNRDYVAPLGPQLYKNPEGEIIKAPRKFRHHLGTDQVGKDVLAGLIWGSRISLSIGLISMSIATLIGILLGSLAGYFGDSNMRSSRIKFILFLLGIFLWVFYTFSAGKGALGAGIAILIFVGLIVTNIAGVRLGVGWLQGEMRVPIDAAVSRLIEILNSLPRLLIIISISAVAGRSITLLMVIIGATSWTGIARFTRAEFLRTRSLEYIDAARSLGYSEARVIFRHALPNSIAPVFVAIAFGIASAILIESTLSFLGVGVPDDLVTWGQMLSKGRENFEAKWLVYWPGFAIFITVTVYNLIGEALRDALDPKLKQ